MPLRNAASPSHATRNSLAPHAARVEFAAKDYVPAGDFEVVIEPARQQSVITVIPHRSGDDGYFMLQLAVTGSKDSPPASRQVVPSSEPLDLRIIADTSASMDAANRKRQGEFVAAVLAALTEKDTFNLATADVDCSWVFAAAKPADAKAAETARQFLAARTSLGWTDLDRTFASALKQCGPKTQVIYVGDGIVTAGDGDPAAFAKRLRRMVDERTHHAPRDAGASQGPHAEREEYGTFHAVATGNSFEPTVMRAIASIGGGSMRQINASGPKAAALDLLHEIAEPGLRDVKVEFHGLRTARVYPDPLPNLATGTQQIILGRYRPEGKEQTGEVIVTGTQDGKPVRFTAPVTLPSASAGEGTLGGPQGKTDCQSVLRTEGTLLPSASGRGAGGEGSSFIPRLWARMHLDALLAQGDSPAVREEIIALSEAYHIITPYTSFLVLESDADRERFKVGSRFRMRDSERYFAEGCAVANRELAQEQMKQSAAWRLDLRAKCCGSSTRSTATRGPSKRSMTPGSAASTAASVSSASAATARPTRCRTTWKRSTTRPSRPSSHSWNRMTSVPSTAASNRRLRKTEKAPASPRLQAMPEEDCLCCKTSAWNTRIRQRADL